MKNLRYTRVDIQLRIARRAHSFNLTPFFWQLGYRRNGDTAYLFFGPFVFMTTVAPNPINIFSFHLSCALDFLGVNYSIWFYPFFWHVGYTYSDTVRGLGLHFGPFQVLVCELPLELSPPDKRSPLP
jgi:hypothetical protein